MCLLDGCLQSVLMGISVQQRRKGTIFKASVFKQKKCISMIHSARNELTLKKNQMLISGVSPKSHLFQDEAVSKAKNRSPLSARTTLTL